MLQKWDELKRYLNEKAALYNNTAFIARDPVSIPHRYTLRQDIEISGLMAATLSWGNRTTIINNCTTLMQLMDDAPWQFVTQHQESDLKRMLRFVHRTFNPTDLLYFLCFFRYHYAHSNTLETAFRPGGEISAEGCLVHFHRYFFSLEHPARTKKHVASPERNSACKRLNMFLRWMVRKDDKGVDFGLWSVLGMHQLVCPMDVHVANVAHRLGLVDAPVANWKNALSLTTALREMNPADPVLYDYALFAMGAEERFGAG